jgi:short-subunit dehydrogenase
MWKDKVVVVTGGSSGLGLSIVLQFARMGSRVVMVGRNRERLDDAVSEVRRSCSGAVVLPVCGDVTCQDDVNMIFDKVASEFGCLDVLVNNAGRTMRGRVIDTTPEQFQSLFDLNVLGVIRCTRRAVPMLLQTRGHIVNIGSLASKSAAKYVGAYPVTKFAVAAYSQQLRLELKKDGIHVLLVCPGPIMRSEERIYPLEECEGIPDNAKKQGAGVKVKLIEPAWLAGKIAKYCEQRKPELIVPAKAKILFAIAQIAPTLADWIVNKST